MNDVEIAQAIDFSISLPGSVHSYTWLNHYSVILNISNNVKLTDFDFVGVDGKFLSYILPQRIETTAADRVLPIVLQSELRVYCIGGTKENTSKRAQVLRERFPNIRLVGNIDGYSSIDDFDLVTKNIILSRAQLVIIGAGSPIQELLTLDLKNKLAAIPIYHGIVLTTCGGWLDQILHDSYYPSWSYKLNLNWAVRLFREPKRLWRRYTINAINAIIRARLIRSQLAFMNRNVSR